MIIMSKKSFTTEKYSFLLNTTPNKLSNPFFSTHNFFGKIVFHTQKFGYFLAGSKEKKYLNKNHPMTIHRI